MARQKFIVDQAAMAFLGISTDAVRKRARRGTLEAEKNADGTAYVWLDDDPPDGAPHGLSAPQAHLDPLEGQVEYLQQIIETRDRELAEMRRLLAGALERIPELEAPREPRESPVSTSEPYSDSQEEEDRPSSGGPPGGAGSYWAISEAEAMYSRGASRRRAREQRLLSVESWLLLLLAGLALLFAGIALLVGGLLMDGGSPLLHGTLSI